MKINIDGIEEEENRNSCRAGESDNLTLLLIYVSPRHFALSFGRMASLNYNIFFLPDKNSGQKPVT